ncbi:MAG TPA: hypothetical protein PK849_06265 [Synergistales bacterium]|nr:hypothetical protein [Synergistaceae bacterium]HOO87452.1 hypothetical protein [Synergistales bacterium]HPE65767.1 hypothetical protein [Synergistales bacterium]HRV98118.1 hypothetical protein [Aminobacteriaceae bacterium]
MKMFKILMIVVVILGCASVSVGAENEDDSIFAKMWSKAMPKLEQALELFERGETLPESKIFGADKQSNNAKYEKLLNEVFDILLDSEFHASRGEYRSLEERIEKSEQKIAELRKERIGAPEESWIPFRQTRSKIDEEVDELKEDIARFRKEKEAIRSSMVAALSAMGVSVDGAKLDILLASVSGDDVIALLLAADSIKKINLQIVDLLRKGEGNIHMARKYTGVHMVLVDIYLHAHHDVLEKIASEYSPRLDSITSSAQLLKKQAEQMLAATPRGGSQREVLETNVKANERTVQTASLYRDYLRTQQNKLRISAEKLTSDLSVARNTYQTVKTGGDLISLINISMRTLESVFGFVLPDLSTVYDQEVLKEFERITGQIRKGS